MCPLFTWNDAKSQDFSQRGPDNMGLNFWHQFFSKLLKCKLTHYLIEMPFNAFANRTNPDQAALIRAAWSGSTLFANGNMIYLILHKWYWQVCLFGLMLYVLVNSYSHVGTVSSHNHTFFLGSWPVIVVVFVFNVPPTAKVIWRRGHGLKSHPTDWWSRESNLRPLVYKASGLSTTPQRLL